MNWELFQDGVTLLSVYILLDTCLLLAVSAMLVLADMIRARINGQSLLEQRMHPDATNRVPRLVRSRIVRLFAWILLPFPLFCVHPVMQLSRRLHAYDPLLFHRIVKVCASALTSGLGVSAWYHNGSLFAWITCLVWIHIIDRTVESDDEDEDDEEGDEDGPDDPTPNGDAAERWLRSLRRTLVGCPE